MRFFTCIFLLFVLITSCNSSVSQPILDTSYKENTNVEITGKWNNLNQKLTMYIDEDLNKIVLSNGCEVISADYKRFSPAINFVNIIKTENTCINNTSNLKLDEVLKETVLIRSKTNNQIEFTDVNGKSLLIVNKN